MKKIIIGIFSLSFLIFSATEAVSICTYEDVQIASSIGNWTERFDGLPPNTDFFTKEDGGVGNLIDGKTENKQVDFWFNHGSMATLEKPAFLTIKLPEAREVTQIILDNTNTKAERTTYSLRFSSDPIDRESLESITQWQDIVADNAIGTVAKDQKAVIDLGAPIKAHYIQAALSTQEQIVALNEIEILGPVGCSAPKAEKINGKKETTEQKNKFPFIALGVLMFAVAGGLVFWKK